MIELKDDELVLAFPEVHEEAVCRIVFQRTLRIPDDNREYPLPPGLGRFSMAHVEDHSARLPASWAERGGVLLPMYQAEALWVNFESGRGFRGGSYPFAVKIAAGKINAVTGDAWSNDLVKEPQDYIVVPDQPWLDGFSVGKGLIRQFIAMPLGQGYTAEEQITGAAEHGGIQVIVYPMKRECYEAMREDSLPDIAFNLCQSYEQSPAPDSMGLAPGGLMRQDIYEDEYGFDVWDMENSSRCFVHILNSAQWTAATGGHTPGRQPSSADYAKAGLPWFEYYDDKLEAMDGSKKLAGLDSVAAKAIKLGEYALGDNAPVDPEEVVKLGPASSKISDGRW